MDHIYRISFVVFSKGGGLLRSMKKAANLFSSVTIQTKNRLVKSASQVRTLGKDGSTIRVSVCL